MRSKLFQLPPHVKPRTRLAMTATGFVLVHIAAYFLYSATAPYMGSLLGILGLLLFILGSSKPGRKSAKKPAEKKYYYFKA